MWYLIILDAVMLTCCAIDGIMFGLLVNVNVITIIYLWPLLNL